jgi:hypothetical protein
MMISLFRNHPLVVRCIGIALATFFIAGTQASADNSGSSPSKTSAHKGMYKANNDKDIILRKNAQSTLYLLSGWGKAEEPYVWFTVSAHFNADQQAPNGKPFNLFSLSGAQDCKENHFFFYRTSYMYFDAKTKALSEVYFKKSKSDIMPINLDTIESSVKSIICN